MTTINIATHATHHSGNYAGANIVDAFFAIARSIDGLATQVKSLGVGNANTEMGAIEFLGVQIKESIETLSGVVEGIANNMEPIL